MSIKAGKTQAPQFILIHSFIHSLTQQIFTENPCEPFEQFVIDIGFFPSSLSNSIYES